MGLTDTYRTFHPNLQNTLSPQAHRIFYKIDHMLDCKISLNKFKNEIITSIFQIKMEWNDKSVTERKHENSQKCGKNTSCTTIG